MNWFDIVIIAAVSVAVIAVVGVAVYKKVKGKGGGCEGCGGNCSGCSYCCNHSAPAEPEKTDEEK